MRAHPLNDGWSYRHLGTDELWAPVTIPHDAMLHEPRDERAASGRNGAWFVGRDYEYRRRLAPAPEMAGASLVLEFEGVYQQGEVWLDGRLLARRPYGYTNFFVDVSDELADGHAAELRVVARNSAQPNSRWYSGAGIYRPVTLWAGPRTHIAPDGLWVRTVSLDPARLEVGLSCTGRGSVDVEVASAARPDVVVARGTGSTDERGEALVSLEVPDAEPWFPEHPALYVCRATLRSDDGGTDVAEASFGIRTLSWGRHGLLLNGRRVVLRGACVHHDNGVLGACAWADAEERKVALLREQGFNALRSAHNPCSKALLDACDRAGMLVMDEYADQWYIHKTRYDYAEHLCAWWRRDLADMVRKDRNHPCVVLYSTGNEVAETAEPRGAALARKMAEHLHALDPTRPVTCGVNVFFNLLSSLGLGQYSDEKAEREAREAAEPRARGRRARRLAAVGSEFFNNLAGLLGAGFMKWGATLPACDLVTRDAFAAMDVAGYNYGIDRYEHDLRAYPGRLILGTETFCSDAWRFSELAESHERLVGDFVWSGVDYLGEVGVGAWEYEDYAPHDLRPGWLTAGSGRLDLTGRPLAEALYLRVALGADDGPYLAVRPVNHTGQRHSPSAWKMSDAIDSWSWRGLEGHVANVEVYARAARVVLLLNGREVARRRVGRDLVARMSCVFELGTLEAVALDGHGRELGRRSLTSASAHTELRAEVECRGSHEGLCFVRVRYTDERGITKPLERGTLRARVEGGELLGFGCAAPYNEGSFVTGETQTYYGEALAVVRVAGPARLSVDDGRLRATVELGCGDGATSR